MLSTMSPRAADPGVRMALLETAAGIIATEGLGKLTLRRLANEVGTSTMAIYTHFGGMTELRREIRREGFARLGAREAAVATTGDPVADVWALGMAYYGNAVENPNLYQAMFMDGPVDEADADAGLETFGQLVTAVQRCIDAGRFGPADPVGLATQLWGRVAPVPPRHRRWKVRSRSPRRPGDPAVGARSRAGDTGARTPVARRSSTPLPRGGGTQPQHPRRRRTPGRGA